MLRNPLFLPKTRNAGLETGCISAENDPSSGLAARVGPDLTHNGTGDAFVARVNASGTSLDYCGYIGGSRVDWTEGRIDVDDSGTRFVQLEPGEERRIDLCFPDTSALCGRVVDRYGRPVPEAKVRIKKYAWRPDQQYAGEFQAYTVADSVGRYRIASVPAGKWYVEIPGKADGPAGDLMGNEVARCPVPISIPG